MHLHEIEKENLHHAYIVEGGNEKHLINFIEQDLGIQIEHNPDISFNTYSMFTIEDSRILKEKAISKTLKNNSKQIFVIILKGITNEAQNALLKLFEEPTQDTHFFICTPTSGIFLPTILSRVNVVNIADSDVDLTIAEKFLNATKKERLDILAKFIKDKDKNMADDLFSNIEAVLYKKFSSGDKKSGMSAMIVSEARNQLFSPGASFKIVVESVALVV